MERAAASTKFPIGSKMPPFKLRNVDGTTIDQSYFDGALMALVIFSCNHCPYVKGSDATLYATIRKFEEDGLKTVIISSNDAEQYPEDGFEKMQEKARKAGVPCPYLYDETQEVARAFDAACTPECYLFDQDLELVYHGAIIANPREGSPGSKNFLAEALKNMSRGAVPAPEYVHPVGCSIKWRA